MWKKILPDKVIGALAAATDSQTKAWLVGGAVRDFFLERPTHDFDFAIAGNARGLARTVADRLGAAYYELDPQRDTGRVLPIDDESAWDSLDFARLRAEDIRQDLALRDFTVNALAFLIEDGSDLLDPTGGLADIRSGRLRLCHPEGLAEDPVRAVRAVRLSAELSLTLERELAAKIKAGHERVGRASVERVRAELFCILAQPRPAQALRIADQLKLAGQLLPRLNEDQRRAGYQRQDHLARIMAAIVGDHDESATANWVLGQASVRLGRFRKQLGAAFNKTLAGGRNHRQLLYWAALYVPEGFPASTLHDLLSDWRMSRAELSRVTRLAKIWRNYSGKPLNAAEDIRSRYRFFNTAGGSGVEICLLALADLLSRQAGPPNQADWERQVESARKLLFAWYEGPRHEIRPEPLVRGDEIVELLDISTGPIVGDLIAAIREAQAVGEINSRQEALELAQREYLARS